MGNNRSKVPDLEKLVKGGRKKFVRYEEAELNSQDVELDAVVKLLLLNWRTVIRKREYSH